MNLPHSPQKVFVLSIALILQLSCSKDSDLLSEAIAMDSQETGIGNYVVDDNFTISQSGSTVLDVLANDTFDDDAVVTLTDISFVEKGTATINNDNNTITYTPDNADTTTSPPATGEAAEDSQDAQTDSFTYTVEFTNEDESVTSEEANVNVTAEPDASEPDASESSSGANGQGVSLQSYGAVGDGVTDDTAALQSAFDNETSITSDAGKTYLVSSQIKLDQNLTQTIDFNNSKIIRNTPVSYPLWIDKSPFAGTNTSINNLEVDGNNLNGSLVYIESRVQFTNVHVHDAKNSTGSASGIRGIYISVKNEPGQVGQWVFDNVDIDYITHTGTTEGEAQNFYVYWPQTVTGGIQIVYKNSTLSNSFGYESNLMILSSATNDISFTNNSLWFENLIFYNFQRRAAKVFLGNTTWINCDFYGADNDNPEIIDSQSAGMFRIGAGSSALGSENNLICGCNFYGGYTQPLNSFDSNIWTGGKSGITSFEMRHSTINGDNPNSRYTLPWTGIVLSEEIGTVKICDCDFTLGSSATRGNKLIDYNGMALVGPKMQIDANNTYAIGETAALAGINSAYYDVVDLSNDCPACPSIDD